MSIIDDIVCADLSKPTYIDYVESLRGSALGRALNVTTTVNKSGRVRVMISKVSDVPIAGTQDFCSGSDSCNSTSFEQIPYELWAFPCSEEICLANLSEDLLKEYGSNFKKALQENANDYFLNLIAQGIGVSTAMSMIGNVYLGSVGGSGAFTTFDGIFPQAMGTPDTKKIPIDANLGGTYAEQTISPEDAKNLLISMVEAVGSEALLDDHQIVCTQSIADAYANYLLSNGAGTGKCCYDGSGSISEDSMFVNYGTSKVKVVADRNIDKLLKKYYNDGTKIDNPHRAILAPKSWLMVFVLAENIEDVAQYTDIYKKGNNSDSAMVVKVKPFGDAKLMLDVPELICVAQ